VTHVFDAGLHLEPAADGVVRGSTHSQWANMVGPFGGMTAATMLRAVECRPDVHGDPLTLTVNFLAPIADGEFLISTRAVRTNRSNQHWIVELAQDGEVKTTATAVFGPRRDTWASPQETPPNVSAPEDIEPQGFPAPITWTTHYEMRFIEGAVPQPGSEPSESSTTTLWVRDQPARPLDFAALTAQCDIFYPRIYLRLGTAVPAGTISMTVYFHAGRDDLHAHGDDFVLATAHAQRFGGGYFDQSGQIWDRNGTLLASTHQLVYFKN
jgi:acyl-CoA thioesterase